MIEKYKIGDRAMIEFRVELVIKEGYEGREGMWLCEDEYGNKWAVSEDELTPLTPQGHPDPPGETGPVGDDRRSRLAEVLGVEETEEIRIVGGGYETDWFCIDQANGTRDLPCGAIVWAINRPESIIRAPRLTEPEIAIMRAIPGARWVSRDIYPACNDVFIWDEKPLEGSEGVFGAAQEGSCLASVRARFFPSVKPGDCVYVGERDDG